MQIRMLREIDAMFEGAPQSRKTLEVKEEMLQNLMEKYNDLIAQGKSEEAAFNIALASVGDISDLVEELKEAPPKVAKFPEPDMSGYEDDGYTAPQESPADHEEYKRHHTASVVSIAVMMYIVSPVALILFGGRMGLILLFVIVAAATGLLVYYGMTRNKGKLLAEDRAPEDDSPEAMARRARMSKQQRRFFSSLSSALWLVTVALYFVISFASGAWHLTWIIFLIAAAVNNVLRAFIDLYRK